MNTFVKCCGAILALASLASTSPAADIPKADARTVDAGVLIDRKFKDPSYLKRNAKFLERLQASGLKAELIDVEENRDRIRQCKRLAVFCYFLFTPETYAELAAYARGGGLVVTNSYLSYVDANANHVYDKAVDRTLKPKELLHGVNCRAAVTLKDIASQIDCPLTRGFEKGKAIECSLAMGETKNIDATVVLTGTAFRKAGDAPMQGMPVVAFKNLGDGAFVYLGIPEDEALFKNCFSGDVLDWLTNN